SARLYRNDFAARQETHQIDEVTSLANDSPATNRIVLSPVISRDGAGIHGHDERFRLLQRRKQRFHLLYLRREAAVETHHQFWATAISMSCSIGGLHLVQPDEVNGQRFFDKYILPSLQRLDDETGMTVMASDDGYSIDGWVREHGTSIGGGFGKTRLLAVYHA